jgi:hypothetical protein
MSKSTWSVTVEMDDGEVWGAEILNVTGGMEEATRRAEKILWGRYGPVAATGIKTMFVGVTLPEGALDIGIAPWECPVRGCSEPTGQRHVHTDINAGGGGPAVQVPT